MNRKTRSHRMVSLAPDFNRVIMIGIQICRRLKSTATDTVVAKPGSITNSNLIKPNDQDE
ncbi:MAG: hypothetical protein IPO83_03640 [Chitinophagaceae bacterium]|nr:hypothetical protein [Chitinophagaceae bacterium]